MRNGILVSFVIFSTFAVNSQAYLADFSAALSNVNDLDLHQIRKRAASETNNTSPGNATQTTDNDVACIVGPLQKFQESIKSNSSGLTNITETGSGSHQFYSRITEDTLDKFCKIYIPINKDISQCANSTLKLYVTDGFAIFDFICVDRYKEFKQEIPCLHKVDEEITNKCTPNCSEDQAAADKFTSLGAQNAIHSVISNDTETMDAFAHFCKHLKCLIKCQTPIIKAQCGRQAVRLLHDGVRVTFGKLNELTETTSSQSFWPKECSGIASHNFNSTANSDAAGGVAAKPGRKRSRMITTYD